MGLKVNAKVDNCDRAVLSVLVRRELVAQSGALLRLLLLARGNGGLRDKRGVAFIADMGKEFGTRIENRGADGA